MIAEVVERPLGDEPPPPVNLSARIDGVTTLRRPEVTDLVEIGRGGFGVVYRARQEQFRRDVAVKVISATLDARARARFTQECRALGQLSGHPHIVSVYDGGIDPDEHGFLVMPFFARGSLAERIRTSGPLDWREAVDVGVRLAGALQTAHEAGILHRDIKPANVLIDEYGAPRLADFGQARFVDLELTRSGEITATPGFAAPEVIQGQSATPSADVYSLAATVMALMLGRPPFEGAGDISVAPVLYRVLSEPPPDLRRLGVPEQVVGVLENAMAKDPPDRPDSALSLAVALQRAQQSLGLPVSPVAVAGRPLLLPPGSDAGPTRVNSPARVGTVPYLHERPPPGTPEPLPPAAAPTRRRWGRLAVAAVLVVALAVAGFFVVRVLNAPEPSQNLVALDLLLEPRDFPGDGWELNTDVTGTLNPVLETSAVLECLGLPQIAQDQPDADDLDARDLRISEVYVVPGVSVQTAGVITASEAQAGDIVDALGPPGFDLCREDFTSFARNFGLTGDTVDYGATPVYSEPALPELTDVVTASSRRIVVPLLESDNGVGSYVIDYVFLAAGSAVACLGIWSYDEPVQTAVRDAVITELVDRLTD